MDSSDKKKTKIIEAATRRFARFGMTKTTMSEIAKDLALSKALLYYYFPDKINLYAAVVAHIIQEMDERLKDELPEKNDSLEAITFIIDTRIDFITKYYNFFLHTVSPLREIPAVLANVIHQAQEAEVGFLSKILEKGNKSGELSVQNTFETASLITYALAGMRFSVLSDTKELIFPTKEEFDQIHELQKKMATIILQGLKK